MDAPSDILTLLASAAADPRLPWAVGIAAVAGLVRGFAGFGSALIYMPLIAAVYGPLVAAPTLLLIDTLCSLPFAIQAAPQSNRREVGLVAIGGLVALPFGALALIYLDPLLLRWFIAVLVLLALAALASGWRYAGKPTPAASIAVGLMAGFGGGSVQIGAPPLLVFWLGGANRAATVRANIMVYFIIQGAISLAVYWWSALFTREVIALALLLGLPFVAAMAVGASGFRGSSDTLYRRVAYVIIGFAGLASMPVFDSLR